MQTTRVSFADFVQFVMLPENEDSLFELIDGEIIQVSPATTRHSKLAFRIGYFVQRFCDEHNIMCEITTTDGAYRIGDHVVAPDFAFKTAPVSDDYPDSAPPLLVAEVISKNDKGVDIRSKRQVYLNAGIIVWEVYPNSQTIDVYVPGQAPRTVGVDDTLDSGAVLPGFTLPVRALFPQSVEQQ